MVSKISQDAAEAFMSGRNFKRVIQRSAIMVLLWA